MGPGQASKDRPRFEVDVYKDAICIGLSFSEITNSMNLGQVKQATRRAFLPTGGRINTDDDAISRGV